MAASTALPPALRIRMPASAASGCPAATMPCCATIVGRQLPLVACGLSCARGWATDASTTADDDERLSACHAASIICES
jgi:hypothetical protein